MSKIKVSYHSGKGYARHNNHYPTKRDKGNINHDLTAQNKIWTCIDGVTDVVEAEKELYNQMFADELELQNNKYRKKGNHDRIRNMDEWMKSERHHPVENILQIGDMNRYIDPKDLWHCYVEFVKWRKDKFGDNLVLISAAMHVDEIENARKIAIRMLKRRKLTVEEIAEDSELSVEEVKRLKAQLAKPQTM